MKTIYTVILTENGSIKKVTQYNMTSNKRNKKKIGRNEIKI